MQWICPPPSRTSRAVMPTTTNRVPCRVVGLCCQGKGMRRMPGHLDGADVAVPDEGGRHGIYKSLTREHSNEGTIP